MKWLKGSYKGLVFSNIYVALAATFLAMESSFIIRVPGNRDPFVFILIFFATVFTYNFQRLVRLDHLKSNASDRLQWMVRNRKSLLWLTVFSAVATAVCAWFVSIFSIMLLAFSGIVSIAYALPVIRYRGKTYMLRDIPFLKIFLIALIWTVVTVFVPFGRLYAEQIIYPEGIAGLALLRFVYIFSITLPFDIRDLRYDIEDGVRTVPSRFGVRNTRRIAILLQVIFTGLAVNLNFHSYFMNNADLAAMIISALITSVVIYFADSNRPELYYSGLLEGMMFVQVFLIWLFRFVA